MKVLSFIKELFYLTLFLIFLIGFFLFGIGINICVFKSNNVIIKGIVSVISFFFKISACVILLPFYIAANNTIQKSWSSIKNCGLKKRHF